MTDQLITIIIPVYKVEKYLDQCVASVVAQTYQNLEIILVDDGSPDRCGAICDAWAAKDSRIRVIHKKNGGLSDARNVGMAAAAGQYLGFVDGDDYIDADMYRLLYERLSADGSDIAACGVEMVWEDGLTSRPLTRSGACVLNHTQAMEALIAESWLKQPVWYKLYKAELIRGIPFPVGKYHEDVFWSWQAVAKAQKVSVFDTPCYFYIQRSGSIMAEGYSLRRLDAIEAKRQRTAFLQREYPDLAARGQIDLLFSCMYHGQLALKALSGNQRRQALDVLKETVKSCPRPSPAGFSITHRIWLCLARINLPIACWIRNLLGVGL